MDYPFTDVLLHPDESAQQSFEDSLPPPSLFHEEHLTSSDSARFSICFATFPNAPSIQQDGSSSGKRRRHTESRSGCISCKMRITKRQSNNYERSSITCQCPTIFHQTQYNRTFSEVMGTPYQLVQLSPITTKFSANDMRLFHHFLLDAHPCVPHHFESVWVRDIPAFSHNYDYLMQAILAISGSHMDLLRQDPQAIIIALHHRQNAINGLNNAFSRWPSNPDEAHAMLATSYLLAFQSGYMADGFIDHILSLRGCNLLLEAIEKNRLEGPFLGSNEVEDSILKPDHPLRLPIVDQDLLLNGFLSLQAVAQLVELPTTKPIEKELYSKLFEALVHLMISPPSAAQRLVKDVPTPDPVRATLATAACFFILTTWPHNEVLYLLSPTNTLGRILLSHFAAIRFMQNPFVPAASETKQLVKALIEWCEEIVGSVQDNEWREWKKYVQWPASIMKGMRWCLNRKRDLTVADMNEALLSNPKVFSGMGGKE